MAHHAHYGPALPYGITHLEVKVWLRYQQHNLQTGDEIMLINSSNGPYGNQVLAVQKGRNPPLGPQRQSYHKVIGVVDQRDTERINHHARKQAGGNGRNRGGVLTGNRFMPDIDRCTVSHFSPHYANQYPHDYGRLAPANAHEGSRRPYILLRVICRN